MTSVAKLEDAVIGALSDDLLQPKRQNKRRLGDLVRGHCYVATEAMFHLLGGAKSPWRPMSMKTWRGTHWYLVNEDTGEYLDVTQAQFDGDLDYAAGNLRGFLTGYEIASERAQELIRRVRRTLQ